MRHLNEYLKHGGDACDGGDGVIFWMIYWLHYLVKGLLIMVSVQLKTQISTCTFYELKFPVLWSCHIFPPDLGTSLQHHHQHTTAMRPLLRPPRLTLTRTIHGLRSFPAWFVRSGTSNGLVINRTSLPPEPQWPSILPSAMGSPDPTHLRQLDGMGSGVSSTSKIIILDKSSDPASHHIDYTVVQAGVRDSVLDQAGNCGNMTAIVGPAAWDMGYVSDTDKMRLKNGEWAKVKARNTNTNKVVELEFRLTEDGVYCPEGEYVMDGVPGQHSCITMSFLDPEGAKTGKALPTGREVDVLKLGDGSEVSASLVDVGNPGVFVKAADLGLDGNTLTPAVVEADAALKEKLEAIRQAGATAMGMDPTMGSVPKIVLVMPSTEEGVDIKCVAMSMGQAHKAAPLTLALCLGAASQLPGTIPYTLVKSRGKSTVTIGHPSGRLDVGTEMVDGKIVAAKLLRTARVLMKGEVFY